MVWTVTALPVEGMGEGGMMIGLFPTPPPDKVDSTSAPCAVLYLLGGSGCFHHSLIPHFIDEEAHAGCLSWLSPAL